MECCTLIVELAPTRQKIMFTNRAYWRAWEWLKNKSPAEWLWFSKWCGRFLQLQRNLRKTISQAFMNSRGEIPFGCDKMFFLMTWGASLWLAGFWWHFFNELLTYQIFVSMAVVTVYCCLDFHCDFVKWIYGFCVYHSLKWEMRSLLWHISSS